MFWWGAVHAMKHCRCNKNLRPRHLGRIDHGGRRTRRGQLHRSVRIAVVPGCSGCPTPPAINELFEVGGWRKDWAKERVSHRLWEYVGIHRIPFHKVAYNSLWYKHLQHIICWWISYIRAFVWLESKNGAIAFRTEDLRRKNLIDTAFNDPDLATERLPAVSGKGFCRQMLASDLKPKNKPHAAPASIIL